MAKRKEKSPAFQWYPKDWLTEVNLKVLTKAQKSDYFDLLNYMWLDEDCSLPDDPEVLCRLVGCEKSDVTKLQPLFIKHPKKENFISSKRLLKERKKQEEWKKKSRKGGLASAKSRVKGGSQMVATKRQPKGNSSSSTPVEEEGRLSKKARPSSAQQDSIYEEIPFDEL